jgi:hypothetical protein
MPETIVNTLGGKGAEVEGPQDWARCAQSNKDRRASTAFGTTYWDKLLTGWVSSRLHSSADEAALGGAICLWAGGGDPGRSWVGMRQCWSACYFIGQAMGALGRFKPEIIRVTVDVMRDGTVVERIGSPAPRHRGPYWSGHVVLHIPEMATIVDPTIGQGDFATADHLRVPVLISNPQLTYPLPPTARFEVRRDPRITLIYNVDSTGDSGEPFETHPLYPEQRASIDAAVARVDGTIADAIEEWRTLRDGNDGHS